MKKGLIILSLVILSIVFFVILVLSSNDDNKYNYNNPYIPKGFKVIEKNINKGLIIEDDNSNQFIWIPINRNRVSLSRKTFKDGIKNIKLNGGIDRIYYGEEVTNSITYQYRNSKKEYVYDIDYFKKSVKKYGGFYISRYEIGDSSTNSFRTEDSKGKIASKKGLVPYNYVSRDEALHLSKTMYNNHKDIISTLINSYAWDTLLEYISIDNKDYVFSEDNNDKNEISKTGETDDMIYNIYDLKGNISEWTTEYSSVGSYEYIANCVYRGESFGSSIKNPFTRSYNDNIKNQYIGFRVILYF